MKMSENELLRFFLRAIKIVQNEHIDVIDTATLIEYALKGMLSALDAHSAYLDRSEYSRLQDSISGSFGGIGVVMISDPRFAGMRVISCLDDTPADKAGILSGDVIIAVDDIFLSQSDGFFTMSEMMRGEPGTVVKISIDRKGAPDILHFFITRSMISVKSVRHSISENIGIIRIGNFDEHTPELLKKSIQDIQYKTKNKMDGYIIDLRKNSGGLVDQAVSCAQLFIDKGVLLRSRGRSGTNEEVNYAVPGLAMVKNVPIVVIIDEGTASAAEMMAGAMQDHKIAVILGTTSFGKGSTQIVMPLDAHVGSAIKVTGKRWYTPHGHPIQGHGIRPDVVVNNIKIDAQEFEDKSSFIIRENSFLNALSAEKQTSKDTSIKKDGHTPATQNVNACALTDQKEKKLNIVEKDMYLQKEKG